MPSPFSFAYNSIHNTSHTLPMPECPTNISTSKGHRQHPHPSQDRTSQHLPRVIDTVGVPPAILRQPQATAAPIELVARLSVDREKNAAGVALAAADDSASAVAGG